MKKFLLYLMLPFIVILGSISEGKSQTPLQTVDFETAGSGYSITGEVAPNASYCWARTDGTVISPDVAFTGNQGTYYFYAENTDGTSGNTQIPVYVTLSSVNVSEYNNFQVKLLVEQGEAMGYQHAVFEEIRNGCVSGWRTPIYVYKKTIKS